MSVLNINALNKTYSNHSGVFNFNLKVETGDIVLLLGPNGAGKTTTFKSILGLIDSESVSIDLLGEPFNRKSSLKKIGAMISKPAFYDYLTGYEHLEMTRHLYKNVDKNKVNQVLEQVGLRQAKDQRVSEYSSGMKQRLDFARAIIHQPKLLLLDEPFSGLDIEAKHDLKMLLKSLQENKDMSIMISSHMVGDLEGFANRVVIIYEGQTLYKGTMESVQSSGLSLEEFYLQAISRYKKGA